MRSMPTILLILAFPAGALAYVAALWVLMAMPLPAGMRGFLVLVVPLFVAGLVMLPFLVPFVDRKAKADLAEHVRDQESVSEGGGDPPDGPQG